MSIIEGIKRFISMMAQGQRMAIDRMVAEDKTGESILHVVQFPKEVSEETMEDALRYVRL